MTSKNLILINVDNLKNRLQIHYPFPVSLTLLTYERITTQNRAIIYELKIILNLTAGEISEAKLTGTTYNTI